MLYLVRNIGFFLEYSKLVFFSYFDIVLKFFEGGGEMGWKERSRKLVKFIFVIYFWFMVIMFFYFRREYIFEISKRILIKMNVEIDGFCFKFNRRFII